MNRNEEHRGDARLWNALNEGCAYKLRSCLSSSVRAEEGWIKGLLFKGSEVSHVIDVKVLPCIVRLQGTWLCPRERGRAAWEGIEREQRKSN